jgi:hypothetical protein
MLRIKKKEVRNNKKGKEHDPVIQLSECFS